MNPSVKRLGSTFLSILLSLVLAGAGWTAFLKALDVNTLVAKTPADVWAYLVTDEKAGDNLGNVLDGLGVTLRDAGLGLVAGLAAAVAVAMAFVLWRTAERSFMPIAMVVRSVPLVAMTPVITLIFGRDLLATTVISGIVVFFPALVTIAFGLRSASPQAADLVRAYGGSSWTTMRKVMVPSALPALFAAARIAAPGSLIGALLAEWLATGKGLGYAMLTDGSTFKYDDLWASVVAVTLASLAVYALIGVLEALVLARFAPRDER
ncbi:ABC transporter permease [Actinomadura parmotrematis]|uniref:ABC transporter permease subunit n=1 Tax=Actinomadura parmotrematis TaxID=2864039 RepID=A0ABS7G1D7_9ACTN|nr:ABC transporter permease subunit [Actinomadura parmotrematis]MBW8485652.1 ABC transporter permease subunit [Actinomadura parmotrematis]